MTHRPDDPADLRASLLDQLAYLIDEVAHLAPVIGRVPEPLLRGRPLPSDRSIKETYALLALKDEAVFLPRLQRMIAEEEPRFDADDDPVVEADVLRGRDWNEAPVEVVLGRVAEARSGLLAFLKALPATEWTRTARFGGERRDVYGFVHHLILHDTEHLRAIGSRLHESHLTDRDRDLPK